MDTPASHARNAMQILEGIRHRGAEMYGGECTFRVSVADFRGLQERLSAIVAQLRAESAPDRDLVEQLREMEQTNRELEDAARGFLDVAIAGVDR